MGRAFPVAQGPVALHPIGDDPAGAGEGGAVVTREDEDRVVGEPELVEGRDDPPHLPVHPRHHRGERGRRLGAGDVALPAEIGRLGTEEAPMAFERWLVGRHLEGDMGKRRRQVEKKRPVGMGAEEMHSLVTDPVGGVGRAAEASEVGGTRSGLGRERRRHRDGRIVERHLHGIVPQNRGIERVRVALAVVAEEAIEARGEGIGRAPRRPEPPLPEATGGVAGSVEDPRQGDSPCRHRSLPLRLHLAVAADRGMTGMEPCHEHAAAGGTDGAAGPVPGEPRAARKQAVDVRRQGMG